MLKGQDHEGRHLSFACPRPPASSIACQEARIREIYMSKNKFVIAPHMRLHEWVAEEKGYFADEGLDDEFTDQLKSKDGKVHDLGSKVGAFQTFAEGHTCNVSSACHWTINVAAVSGHGMLYRDAYSVAPAGIFVPADSAVKSPADLANVPVSVVYQSGSHYSTIQVLEQWLERGDIRLSFNDGLWFRRLELLDEGKIPAVHLFSVPMYVAEQLGFRKICDCTFMMAGMVNGNPDIDDVKKFDGALQRAQRDIDLRPELYTHYYLKELPARIHGRIDTGRMGPGERIVFEPYTREVFDESRECVAAHDIFPDRYLGRGGYGQATIGALP